MHSKAQLISAVVDAPPERWDAIIATAKSTERPRLGTVAQAAAILDAHPRTVQRYVRAGLLHEIRITARRIRYDLKEVERLATTGAGGRMTG